MIIERNFRFNVHTQLLIGISILLWVAWSTVSAIAGAEGAEITKGRDFYREVAEIEALRQNIPFYLVDAVMEVESDYDSSARGKAGEVGLMQVMPQTAALLGFKGSEVELADPVVNIAIGTKYLAQAWKLARKDICTTVMKYRAGHGEFRFSQRSVTYCARVRAHLQANGFPVTGELPKVDFWGSHSPPGISVNEPNHPNLEVAGFSSLAAFGNWVPYKNNHVWVPHNINADWRPYTVGRWAFTKRYGWIWVSDEPFGWATYHYGRWGYAKEVGWYWVPDKHWAPAWVSWRRSTEYIAWAPLPPSGNGTKVSANIDCCLIPFNRWTAVPVRNFLDKDLSYVVVRDSIKGAQPIGTVRVENRIVVNKALSVSSLEQRTKRRVAVYDVKQTDNPNQVIDSLSNQIVVFRVK